MMDLLNLLTDVVPPDSWWEQILEEGRRATRVARNAFAWAWNTH